MRLLEFCQWLESQRLSQVIAESPSLFPVFETIHVLSIVLVVGSIAMLDLRLIGVSSRLHAVDKLAAEVLPWTWVSFAAAAIAGTLMFISRPTFYYNNIPFRFKLAFLALAGLNMAVFHSTTYRSVRQWNQQLPPPDAARVAGGLSLTFWICVVFFGRFAGFVEP